MANVIHVGTNEAVMTTRKTILEKPGHAVTLALDLLALIAACEESHYHVGILCQSLPTMEKLRISDVLRKDCPDIGILDLHNGVKPDLSMADANLQVAEGTPEVFLEGVNRLSHARGKGKASK